jgi:hypothetical protein
MFTTTGDFAMQTTPEKLPPKTNEWANRLARFEASGQFVAEFCHAEGVSVPNFYRWRKILSEANIAPVQKSEFIELGPLALSPAASELTVMMRSSAPDNERQRRAAIRGRLRQL